MDEQPIPVYPIPKRFERENRPSWVLYLNEALNRLWDGKSPIRGSRYICLCIGDSYLRAPLVGKIERHLGRFGTYQNFVCSELGIKEHEVNLAALQDGRRRWVLQMIEDFGGVPDERK